MKNISDGFLLVNKPLGITSRRLVDMVARQTSKKVGHTGTLDPLATGMMVLAIGDATKFSKWIVSSNKAYEAEVQFGSQTSTDDAEGDIVEHSNKRITKDDMLMALPQFLGNIQQRPPNFSAIHINGKRAYKLARSQQEFEIPSRQITIHDIHCISFDEKTQQTRLYIHCQSGTYIRSIARDLGKHLECFGHLSNLKRLWISPFEKTPFYELDDTRLSVISLESYFMTHAHIPHVLLNKEQALSLANGQTITLSEQDTLAAFYQDHFLGIIEPSSPYTYRSIKLRPNIQKHLTNV